MTDNERPEPAGAADGPLVPPTYAAAAAAAAAAPKAPLRHRVLSLPAVAGVAAASLILGGVGGATLGAVTGGDSHADLRGGPRGLNGGPNGGQPPGLGSQPQGQQAALPRDDD